MNNNVNKSFYFRHAEGSLREDGLSVYEEDFYLNRQRPPVSDRAFLHLFAYGESLWRKGYQLKRNHSGNWWSFELIIEGDAEFVCNKIRYKLIPGDILIIRPENFISIRPGKSGFTKKRCVLIESPLLDFIYENGNLAGVHCIQNNDTGRMIEIFNRIKKMILSQCECLQEDFSVQSYALLAEIKRLAAPRQYPLPLKRALDMIDAYPSRDFSLELLSSECGVSVSTLSRLFRSHLDISPVNYIIDRRLEQAKMLIDLGDMTLKEIADKCGYKSESFFSRSFKKKYGVPPASFRR
jgi:AraC-like DNA-binding protein